MKITSARAGKTFACRLFGSAFSPRRLVIFGIFFFFVVFFAAAQSGDDAGRGRITAISITGLRRTRLSTAERSLRKFIGREANQIDPDEVRAAVLATGILEPLSVEIEDDVLSVIVHEKWAIIPIPIFMAGSGGTMAGLALMDSNAFGLNDKLFLAGIYHTDGWSASVGYIHASPGGHIPGWNSMAGFSREVRYDRNQRNEVLRCFGLDSISFYAGLNFPLTKDADLLFASALFSYYDKTLRESENDWKGPDEGLRLFGAGAELAVRKSSWDGYLLSQEAAALRYFYRTNLDGFYYQSISFRGIWEKSLVPGFRFISRTGLVFEPEVPILFESSPFAAQVAILPGGFSAKNYAGFSAGLEKYIYKFSAGTLSLAAAYQLVYSRASILDDSLDHGPMGMLSFYLSRLAMPALGLGVAYNVKEEFLQAAFNLGMSF